MDTNIAIYFLDGKLTPNAFSFVLATLTAHETAISVITKMEVLGWKFPSAGDEQKAVQFFDRLSLHWLSVEIVAETIEIRKAFPKTKLPDAIIAATAKVHGLTLLSRNTGDFSKIPGLRLFNPFDL